MPSRRQFCMSACRTGLAGLSTLCGLRAEGHALAAGEPREDQAAQGQPCVARSATAMGTRVSIEVLHADTRVAEEAIRAAFAELQVVEQVMSLYLPESQLCRLNAAGRLTDPHPYLVDVLRRARAMSEASEGAFDVTVQPLWVVYAEAKKADRLPEPAAVEAARAKVDWRRVEIRSDEIRLQGEGTAVTLNAIAQGFAADSVARVLRCQGMTRALVNTGELRALGGKAPGQPWKVGIQHPRIQDAYVALVGLEDRGLATSGDYATPLSSDLRVHHIFDPRIGRSPVTLASVSVVAPEACTADALATTVFVLGADKGLSLVRATAGCEALVVFRDGRVLATDGFPTCPT